MCGAGGAERQAAAGAHVGVTQVLTSSRQSHLPGEEATCSRNGGFSRARGLEPRPGGLASKEPGPLPRPLIWSIHGDLCAAASQPSFQEGGFIRRGVANGEFIAR